MAARGASVETESELALVSFHGGVCVLGESLVREVRGGFVKTTSFMQWAQCL